MSRKKVLMSASAAAVVASAFVATEDVSAASYKVSQGDSLWKIAQAHGVSVADLKKWNNLKHELVFPDQVLQVMEPVDKGSSKKETTNVSNTKTNTHIVKTGDTLSEIAFANNISVKDLMKLNNLNSTLIFPGNILSIADEKADENIHTIVAGDTLSHLALKYDTTAQTIADLNNIKLGDIIYVGDQLKIDGEVSSQPDAKAEPKPAQKTESKPEVTQPKEEVKPEPEAEPVEEVEEQPKQEEEAESNAEANKSAEDVSDEKTAGSDDEDKSDEETENSNSTKEDKDEDKLDEKTENNNSTKDDDDKDKSDEAENNAPVDEAGIDVEKQVEEVATEVKEESEPTPKPEPEPEPVVKDEPKTETTNGSTYVVKSGDTLSKIATAHGTTAAKIASLSNINQGETLQVGDKLTVDGEVTSKPKPEAKPETKPEPEVKPEPTPEPEPVVKDEPKTEATNGSTYVVKSGDSLSKIATAHGTTAAKIASLNGIKQDKTLQIGDKLTVDGEVTSKPKPEAKPESKPEATKPETKPEPEVKPEPTPDKNASTYVVKSGDTLATIASAHGTTAQKIASNSGISLDTVLHIGDKLSVNGEAVNNSNNNSSPVVNTDNKTPKPETKPEPTPKPPANAGFSANQLMSSANSVMGTKYVWGGTTQSGGFDCSGFIHWAYNDAGKEMPRTSTDGYYDRSYHISKSELQVGDLVFFSGTYRPGISHMGIYAGNNEFKHAATSTGVTTTSLDNPYWSKHFDSFKRFY